MIKNLATAMLALVFGFLGAATWSYAGLADNRTRAFMLENPELLPQMAEAYRTQENAQQLATVRADVVKPFPGAFIGNPNGTKVLVEFADYNCTYCKQSLADVQRLTEEDPELKVIIREWSIFEGSEMAARMALAAAMQGKYADFHYAMFRLGPATPETVEAAAVEAGLDMDRARADAVSDPVSVELARNMGLAQQLGVTGTPAWVTGQEVISGAVGFDVLKTALEEAGAEADHATGA
ncbi:MAG: DsbA family protein [Pseudomonadota bacterium]